MLSTSRHAVFIFKYRPYSMSSLKKQANMFKKLLNRDLKKRNDGEGSSKKLAKQFFPKESEVFDKKTAALNKVYMENITEIMSTGKESNRLLDMGINITEVMVQKKLGVIKIYWTLSNTQVSEEEIIELLNIKTVELKEALGIMKNIGKPPDIKFVKDMESERMFKTEQIFSSPEFLNDLKKADALGISPPLKDTNNLPEMRHDLLGLDRSKINDRIITSMLRNEGFTEPKLDQERSDKTSKQIIPFDKQLFYKFYRRKCGMQIKIIKDEIRKYETEVERETYEVEKFFLKHCDENVDENQDENIGIDDSEMKEFENETKR